jgi:hypothetical protein
VNKLNIRTTASIETSFTSPLNDHQVSVNRGHMTRRSNEPRRKQRNGVTWNKPLVPVFSQHEDIGRIRNCPWPSEPFARDWPNSH